MDTELNREPHQVEDPKKKKSENNQKESVPLTDAQALALASSQSLADWNRPEEDEAWKDL